MPHQVSESVKSMHIKLPCSSVEFVLGADGAKCLRVLCCMRIPLHHRWHSYHQQSEAESDRYRRQAKSDRYHSDAVCDVMLLVSTLPNAAQACNNLPESGVCDERTWLSLLGPDAKPSDLEVRSRTSQSYSLSTAGNFGYNHTLIRV